MQVPDVLLVKSISLLTDQIVFLGQTQVQDVEFLFLVPEEA